MTKKLVQFFKNLAQINTINKTTLSDSRMDENSKSASLKQWQWVKLPEKLLKEARFQCKIQELKALISITPEYYQKFYLKTLYNFAALFQELPHPNNIPQKSLLETALERIITALKFRRGYMLPRGADTETCYKEQDAWTYALFISALLQECWLVSGAFEIKVKNVSDKNAQIWHPLVQPLYLSKQKYCFKITPIKKLWKTTTPFFIKMLLPESALEWLSSYPLLFYQWWESWVEADTSITTNNPLIEILKKTALMPEKQNTKNTEITILEKIDLKSPKNNPIKPLSCDETHKENNIKNKDNKNNKENRENKVLQKEVPSPSDNSLDFSGKFIACLKEAIKRKHLKINESESYIHRVAEGIFLILPELLEKLLLDYTELQVCCSLTSHCCKENEIYDLLIKSRYFICNVSQNTCWHRYFRGRWEDRQVVSGFILPCETLFDNQPYPPINENLHLEPAI